ncbi:Retrovirus-related Pol polyprotein from transposon 412 [Anthophora plagiata]
MFTYNTTPHTATDFSPYELLYGRQSELPTALTLPPQSNYTYDRYAHELKQRLRSTNAIARDALKSYKLRTKEYYDRSTTNTKFKIEDHVLLHDAIPRRGRVKKLSSSWTRPYTVVQTHTNENYTIKKGHRAQRVHTC